MAWNGREGNQKKKIVKNGTRWGQILCSGKKNCSFTEVGKEGEWVYVCGRVRNTYGRNGFCLFVYFFWGGVVLLACFLFFNGFFSMGSISLKLCKSEIASKLDEIHFKFFLILQIENQNAHSAT